MDTVNDVHTDLRINAARLQNDLEELGEIGRVSGGGRSRTSYSEADLRAREWYLAKCAEAGLSVAVDGLGNMVVSNPDDVDGLPVWSGSHIDTVPNGGRFDGALGAIAALECLRTIKESNLRLPYPMRAVVFADEEGNYDHLLGSSAMRHGYSSEELAELTGRDGDRLVDRLSKIGWDLEAATRTRVSPGAVRGFVELHIEQGPVLEEEGIDIGVVTSIVGLGGAKLAFLGSADHAGTTPMGKRRDALRAAADFLTEVPLVAASIDASAVATCGVIAIEPGSANVVPGRANLLLDFRSPSPQKLQELAHAFEALAHGIADKHGMTLEWKTDRLVDPVPLDSEIRDVIAQAADGHGFSRMSIPSGAGHDSQNMAWIAPTAMIFVPSIAGKSHCPEEDTAWHDIANGANVLLSTLIAIASSPEVVGSVLDRHHVVD